MVISLDKTGIYGNASAEITWITQTDGVVYIRKFLIISAVNIDSDMNRAFELDIYKAMGKTVMIWKK